MCLILDSRLYAELILKFNEQCQTPSCVTNVLHCFQRGLLDRVLHSPFLPFAVSLWNKLEETKRTITNYELFKDTLMRDINEKSLIFFRLKAGANNYG